MKISAIIVVNGNPPHLTECLKSIENHVDEILIGDVGMSVKQTSLQSKKIRVINCDESVAYADLIKEDLKNQAKGDYVLYLDPDEIVSETFWDTIEKEAPQHDYFLIPRKNIIFGKWIAHSRWWPDYQIRFFKKESVVWPKTIHPKPITSGREYKFAPDVTNAITHYNYDSITHYLEKAQRYARSEADEKIKRNEVVSFTDTLSASTGEFISRYFAFEGYKDGMHGFVLALFQMFYYFLVYFYYWEMTGYKEENHKKSQLQIVGFFKRLSFEANHWIMKKNIISGIDKARIRLENQFLKKYRKHGQTN